jgi:hypothetical protein
MLRRYGQPFDWRAPPSTTRTHDESPNYLTVAHRWMGASELSSRVGVVVKTGRWVGNRRFRIAWVITTARDRRARSSLVERGAKGGDFVGTQRQRSCGEILCEMAATAGAWD